MESIRGKIRKQLAARYRQDLEKGIVTLEEIQELIEHLQSALEKARKTNRRVLVEGQEHMGNLSDAEIEDQMSAFRLAIGS